MQNNKQKQFTPKDTGRRNSANREQTDKQLRNNCEKTVEGVRL